MVINDYLLHGRLTEQHIDDTAGVFIDGSWSKPPRMDAWHHKKGPGAAAAPLIVSGVRETEPLRSRFLLNNILVKR